MQSFCRPLAAGEDEFLGQLVNQPPELQNVPTGHCSHGPPAGPENPSLHLQSSTQTLPASELLFPAQLNKYPLEQKVSAGHSKQGPPAGPENP
eukprot:1407124-Rhodomonas_salina.1